MVEPSEMVEIGVLYERHTPADEDISQRTAYAQGIIEGAYTEYMVRFRSMNVANDMTANLIWSKLKMAFLVDR